MEKKVIGIIGGMGPMATADMFRKIVLNTKAEQDQDHLRILIDNNVDIPDRTAAILRGGEDPSPALISSAKSLKDMGAQLLIIPCNTAHYFHANVQAAVDIPVLHMIELTCQEVKERGAKCIGLMATDGTIQTGIYQKAFQEHGIKLIHAEGEDQAAIMDVIYNGVKAGALTYDTTKIRAVMDKLLAQGAELLVLGCTELPLAVENYHLTDYPIVDSTKVLAKAAIKEAGGICLL